MGSINKRVACKCPRCWAEFTNLIDPKRPPKMKKNVYSMLCFKCHLATSFPSLRASLEKVGTNERDNKRPY